MAEPGVSLTAWAVFSAIGGSVVGAIISATVSFYIQRRNLDAAKQQRKEDKIETQKALGYALLFKLIRISSNLESLGATVRSTLEKAKKDGFKAAKFQIVMPVAPLPDKVTFNPDEMAMVLSISDKVFNEIAALDELHNSTVHLFQMYNDRRAAVMERFGAKMDGPIGTTGLTEQDKLWLEPRAFELNQLVDYMLERSLGDGKEAWAALESLHSMLRTEFGIKQKLERKQPIKLDG